MTTFFEGGMNLRDGWYEFTVIAGECSFEGSCVPGENRVEGEINTREEGGGYAPQTFENLIKGMEFEFIELVRERDKEYGENHEEEIGEIEQLIRLLKGVQALTAEGVPEWDSIAHLI